MSTATTSHELEPTTKHQIEREDRDLFWKVIETYCKCGDSIDNEQAPTGLEMSIIDFVEDVPSVTWYALEGTALLDDWFCLVDGIQIPSDVKELIIRVCSPLYRANGLDPDLYFNETSEMRKQRRDPSGLVGTRGYCKLHGLQIITACIRDSNGHILQFDCGCDTRPARESDLSVAASPAAPSHSIDA